MLAKHCLEEFKLDCQLRRLTDRTIKGYYNNTLNFLIYAEKPVCEMVWIFILCPDCWGMRISILQRDICSPLRIITL